MVEKQNRESFFSERSLGYWLLRHGNVLWITPPPSSLLIRRVTRKEKVILHSNHRSHCRLLCLHLQPLDSAVIAATNFSHRLYLPLVPPPGEEQDIEPRKMGLGLRIQGKSCRNEVSSNQSDSYASASNPIVIRQAAHSSHGF